MDERKKLRKKKPLGVASIREDLKVFRLPVSTYDHSKGLHHTR